MLLTQEQLVKQCPGRVSSSDSSSGPLLLPPVNQHSRSSSLSLSAALSKVATRQWSKLRPLSEFRARYRTGPYIASSSSPTSRTRSEKCFSSADQWTRALYSDSIDIFSRNVIVDCTRQRRRLSLSRDCNGALQT